MGTQFHNHCNFHHLPVQHPELSQSLFCEEDELVLDYDMETLKNFDLFSSTFSYEDLINEIPLEMPPQPPSTKGVREDCMWAEDRIEEKLDIDVINHNTGCSQLQLVPPESIISIKKDYFMRHLIPSSDTLNIDDGYCHDYNNNCLESPTSSSFESSDDGCSPSFNPGFNEQFFGSNDSDEEIDVVGGTDQNPTILPTQYQRSTTTPTCDGVFNMNDRNHVQCVLETCKHDNEERSPKIVEENRHKRPRRNTSKNDAIQDHSANGSSSEETNVVKEKMLNRSASHNHLEKKRRINLKRKFEILRSELPTIGENDKAAKVFILTEAIRECQILKAKERELLMEKRAILITQETLQNRIASLTGRPYGYHD